MRKKGLVSNCYNSVKLMFQFQLLQSIGSCILSSAYALAWVGQVIFMQRFFDNLIAYTDQATSFVTVFYGLIFMGIMYFFYHVLDGISNCISEIMVQSISMPLNKAIFARTAHLNLLEYEEKKRLDYINRAMKGSNCVVGLGITVLDCIFYYLIYFIFIGWYLFSLKPILVLSIILIFIPCIAAQFSQAAIFKELEEQAAPIRRRYEYYEKCLVGEEYLKETRLLGAVNFFWKLYEINLKELNKLVFLTQLKKNLKTLFFGIITVLGYGGIIYLLFISVMNREISLGAFTAVLSSIANLYRFMNKLISERLGWLSENAGAVEHFFEFIQERPVESLKKEYSGQSDVHLKQVSFSYPDSEQKIFENLDLTIHNNETIAIVGENGSGKTTLCRLILGMYPATAGKVYYGGQLAGQLNNEGISAIFQRYREYKMSLMENLCISDLEKEIDAAKIRDICDQVGIAYESDAYESGLQTYLGRDFGGTELSGGQWQRIAIGRGIYRNSSLIIMDEPTAAIDPLEESRLYHEFSSISKNKTAVIVTHRLSSVKFADRIIVLQEGKIVQDGKHNELVKAAGLYRTMYETQKKWYEDDVKACSNSH